MNIRLFFKVTLIVLAASQTSQAQTDSFAFTPIEVANGVYSIVAPYYGRPTPENRGWNANSHFVVTDDGVLVVDTGSSTAIGNALLNAIKTVTDKPVRWVVNTHSHADHWLGNASFAQIGAEILSTPLAIKTMRAEGQMDIEAFSRMSKGATGDTKLAFPQRSIKSNKSIILGGIEIQFILSDTGHSPGDLLVWLPKQSVIIGGDILSSQWMPIMTPRGHVTNLLATLNQVIKLEPRIVLPGHGNATDIGALIRDVSFLSVVWAIVEKGIKANQPVANILDDVKTHMKLNTTPDYQDYESNIGYMVDMMHQKQQKKMQTNSVE